MILLAAPAAAQTIRTVEASGPPVWSNPRLVEELRIGRIDGPDEYIFGSVRDIAPMPDGSIFVVDGQGPRLRLYSPDGRFVRDVNEPYVVRFRLEPNG